MATSRFSIIIASTLVFACGRVGYDPLAVATDDADPVVSIDANLIDDGEVPVTDPVQDSNNPSIVWNGNGYGLAYHSSRDSSLNIYFAELDAAGSMIGVETQVTSIVGIARDAQLVWSGSGYGLAWRQDTGTDFDLYFQRLAANGDPIGVPFAVTTLVDLSGGHSMVYAESQYSMVWSDRRSGDTEVYFSAFSNNGTQLVAPVSVINAGAASDDPAIAFSTNSGLIVTWSDSRTGAEQIYSSRMEPTGVLINPEVRSTMTATDSVFPEVAHGGTELGFAYIDTRTGTNEIFFSAHIMNGVISIDQLQLSTDSNTSSELSIAAANNTYVVVWEHGLTVHYAYVAGGVVASSGQVNSDLAPAAKSPDVVWNGSAFVVVWEDTRLNATDTIFLRALNL